MFRHVGTNFQAEVEATGIDIELTSLEGGSDVLVVEVDHGHVVAQQGVEIAIEVQQAFQRLDGIVLVVDLLLMAFVDALGLLVLGGHIVVDLLHYGIPLLLGEGVLAGIVDIQNQFLDLGKLALPSGVDTPLEREQCVGTGLGKRVLGNLLDAGSEILLADFGHLLDRYVEGGSTVVVELDKLTTQEIVGHLVADSVDSCHSIITLVAIRSHVDREVLQRSLEVFGAILVVMLQKLVQLGKGDSGLFQAHNLQHRLGAFAHLRALLVVGIEIREVDIVVPLKNLILVLHHRAEPLGSRNNLVGTDFAVAVVINQVEGALIQFETFDWAAQHCPHLLVQLTQMSNILTTGDAYSFGTS